MQTLTKATNATIDELQSLVEAASTPRERASRRFIVDAFRGKMSSLIPFALENESVVNIASYLLKYTKSKSKATLYQYVFGVSRFCRWIKKTPDAIVREVLFKEKAIDEYVKAIDSFVGDLQAEGLVPGTINNHVKDVKTLFRVNGLVLPLRLGLPFR